VETAIAATLPSGPGQRNRKLFEFCRQLKAIPDLARKPASELKQYVQAWQLRALPTIRTKDFATTWVDFVVAWSRVRKPAAEIGVPPLAAMTTALAKPLCVTAQSYPLPDVRKLVMLCREMHLQAGGGRFFLSCDGAADVIGTDSKSVYRWFEMLQADGVIRLIEKGQRRKPRQVEDVVRASVWEYIGD
jgi:hypothetical protein